MNTKNKTLFTWKGKKKPVCFVGSMNIGFIREFTSKGYSNRTTYQWFTRLDHPKMKQWRPNGETSEEAKKFVEESFLFWLRGCKEEVLEYLGGVDTGVAP